VAFWASWKSDQLSHFKVAMIAALTVASGASVRVAFYVSKRVAV